MYGEGSADPPDGLTVRLLGPVEVHGPLGPGALSGSRQRTLVGLLALRAGTVLARSRIIDALWGEDPPRTALKTLYSHVVRVRQAFVGCGLPDVLTTRDPGYALGLPAEAVDALVFERRVEDARRELAAGRADHAVAGLRAGLALWRGDPFADGEPASWGAAEVVRLHEVRLTALEDLWAAELARGGHIRAVAEVDRLLTQHPLRERLVELLMLALYRSGRHASALDAYRRLRAQLREEVGVDPSPALQRLHTRILRRDPDLDAASPTVDAVPGAPVPAHLPGRVGHFVGRVGPLAELDKALDGADRPLVAVVSGAAGMGKTAVAVEWAHRVRGRFPDGQLFLDLGGHDPATALSPSDALGHLLQGLGVVAARVPTDLADQVNLYRSLLAGRRMLVLLDNVAGAEQILPLIPGTETSLLLLTCRRRLAGLATRHAVHLVSLEVLHPEEAVDLLGRVLGGDRVAREPAAAGRIADLCGRLPLALRIAVAKLTAEPDRRLADLAAELSDEDRLAALSVEDDPRTVRTAFASAYRALSPPAAAVFRRLGAHPGTTFAGIPSTAALMDAGPGVAAPVVAELAAAHLIERAGPDRYRFHDLIRLYARERSRSDDTAAERADAAARILDWYLAVAEAANRMLERGRNRVRPQLRHAPVELPFPAERAAALAFLDGEQFNLVPVVRYAAEHGFDDAAWQLTYLLAAYFDLRGRWADRVEMCRWGLRAAERGGDPFPAGLMCTSLGLACCEVRRFDEALTHLGAALAFSRASGDRRGEGAAHNNIAVAYVGQGRLADAVDAFQRALAVHSAHDHAVGVVLALNNIGDTYSRMGQVDLALDHLDRALKVIREVGGPRYEAVVLDNIGQAHLRDDRPADALGHFAEALAIRRRIGDRRYEVDTLNHMGAAYLAVADHAAAVEHLSRAVTASQEIDDPHFEAIARGRLGRAYLAEGRPGPAREQLRLALVLRTRVPDAEEEVAVRRHLAAADRLAAGA